MSLRLELELPPDPLRRSTPSPVTVILTNTGSEPVVANRRMSPGYANSLSRELYFDVEGSFLAQKYHREFAESDDYVELPPGDRLCMEVELLDWYRLREPGVYRVTAHYQCDEPLADAPPDVVRGVVDSPTYTVTVE